MSQSKTILRTQWAVELDIFDLIFLFSVMCIRIPTQVIKTACDILVLQRIFVHVKPNQTTEK